MNQAVFLFFVFFELFNYKKKKDRLKLELVGSGRTSTGKKIKTKLR
jgi:hypothetical protein